MTSFVYVSSADDGIIGVYHLGPDGSLQPKGRVAAGKAVGPLAVSPDKGYLYAAIRSQPVSVLSYAIDAHSGDLRQVSAGPAAESYPYISTDHRGRFLFGASYGADLIAVHPIDTAGHVGAALQVIPIARNAHCIRIDATNRFVFVPALGTDRIYQFVFDAAKGHLSANSPPFVQLAAGTGPRHVALSSDNRFVYLLSELTGMVTTLALDGTTGLLKADGSESILPPDSKLGPGLPRGAAAPKTTVPRNADNDIWASDVHLRPDGRFLYAAERTGSTLSVLRVDGASGKLAYEASVATEAQPRGFAIDSAGQFIVAAGEKSPTISSYAIGSDGIPKRIAQCETGMGSNWVEIVKRE